MGDNSSLGQHQHLILQRQVHQQLQRIYGNVAEQRQREPPELLNHGAQQLYSNPHQPQRQAEPLLVKRGRPGGEQVQLAKQQPVQHHPRLTHSNILDARHQQQRALLQQQQQKQQQQQQLHVQRLGQPQHRHHHHHHPHQHARLDTGFESSQRTKEVAELLHGPLEQPLVESSRLRQRHEQLLMVEEQEEPYDNLTRPGLRPSQHQMELASSSSSYNSDQRIGGPPRKLSTSGMSEQLSDKNQLLHHHHHHQHLQQQQQYMNPVEQAQGIHKEQVMDEARNQQLEDLHYATATAAALLNATANAAAAFAVGSQSQRLTGPDTSLESVYDEAAAHQEFRRSQSHSIPNSARAMLDFQAAEHQVAPMQAAPSKAPAIYSALDGSQLHELRSRRGPSSGTTVYSPLVGQTNPQQVQQQQQVYGALPLLGLPHQLRRQLSLSQSQRPALVPIAYFGPDRSAAFPGQLGPRQRLAHTSGGLSILGHSSGPMQAINSGQQLHRASADRASSLALVRWPNQKQSGALALKADLVGRMMMNNLLAEQRAAAISGPQHCLAKLASQSASRPGQFADSKASNKSILDAHMIGHELLFNISARSKLLGGSQLTRPLAASCVGSSEPIISRGPPFHLDKRNQTSSLVERICNIDLTVFWWSLLIVSFLFAGTLIFVSRYLL